MNTVKYNRIRHKKTFKKYKKPKIIIGLVYANWCGHCQALKPEWKKMKNNLKSSKIKNNHQFVEIEDSDIQKNHKMNQINTRLKKGEKINVQGYPTIFKIKGGNLEYYKGERTSDEMGKWAFKNGKKIQQELNEEKQGFNNNFLNMLGGKKGGGCGCGDKIW